MHLQIHSARSCKDEVSNYWVRQQTLIDYFGVLWAVRAQTFNSNYWIKTKGTKATCNQFTSVKHLRAVQPVCITWEQTQRALKYVLFSASCEYVGKTEKVKRGRVLHQHRHLRKLFWNLFFQFPVNMYSATRVGYCLSVVLQKNEIRKSLLPPLNLRFHGQHGLWITKHLQAFVYTHNHKIKITPSSAHTQANHTHLSG